MTSRKPMMAGNWKMHKNAAEAVELVRAIGNGIDLAKGIEVVVFPPFTALKSVATTISYDELEIGLGAQNLHWESAGAFTGEISGPMLKQLEVEYVLVGHSERRQFFGETNETVNKKIKAALEHDLKPICCVGENLEEKEAHKTTEVISTQLIGGLSDLAPELASKLTIAYEPVWAIGTGKVAEPEDANDVIRHIRAIVGSRLGQEVARDLRILYGGSVKPDNIGPIMEEPEIDGALVGGASLDPESFLRLTNN